MRALARTRQAGFTIIEVVIVLAVIGLAYWALLRGAGKVTKSDLREDTMRIAAALRTAYNLATETGRHHRVVFDLDQQAYRIEACEGKILLRKGEVEQVVDQERLAEIQERLERVKQTMDATKGAPPTLGANTSDMVPEIVGADTPEKAAEAAAALEGVQLGPIRCRPPTLPDGKPDKRGEPQAMRKEAKLSIRQIYVSHLQEPAKEGIAAINFFPLGTAQKAVIEVVNADADRFTVLVHRITGRVEVRSDDVDSDKFMNRDGAGDDEEER